MNTNDIAREAINRRAQQDYGEFSRVLDICNTLICPETVLEIGSHWGGSLWAWNQMGYKVTSITLQPEGDRWDENKGDATVFFGDSTTNDIIWNIQKWRYDLVFIDGGHDYITAKSDWLNFGRHANKACIIHDINKRDNLPELEVWKLWEELRQEKRTSIVSSETSPGTGLLWTSR